MELQAAALTVKTIELKFEEPALSLLSSTSFSLPAGPPMRYENLGCAVLGSPLAVVIRSVVRGSRSEGEGGSGWRKTGKGSG